MFDPQRLAELIRQAEPDLRFTVMDIGAAPIGGHNEPYHRLPHDFPGSRVIGFEVDPQICARMNRDAPEGFSYHALAIGRADEERPFYVARNPICSSLYRPNDALIARYNHMDIALLDRIETIQTRALDGFANEQQLGDVDMIKIDIQGAELEAFQGGEGTLRSVLAIVSEVEFVPHYEDQPLFGEICRHLDERGLIFHRFITLGGSTLKPFGLPARPMYATQDIWADAIYLRDVQERKTLDATALLKLATLANLYGSIDVTFVCLRDYDARCGTALAEALMRMSVQIGGDRP